MPASGRGFDWEISMGGYAVGNESNVAPDNWATWVPAGGGFCSGKRAVPEPAGPVQAGSYSVR